MISNVQNLGVNFTSKKPVQKTNVNTFSTQNLTFAGADTVSFSPISFGKTIKLLPGSNAYIVDKASVNEKDVNLVKDQIQSLRMIIPKEVRSGDTIKFDANSNPMAIVHSNDPNFKVNLDFGEGKKGNLVTINNATAAIKEGEARKLKVLDPSNLNVALNKIDPSRASLSINNNTGTGLQIKDAETFLSSLSGKPSSLEKVPDKTMKAVSSIIDKKNSNDIKEIHILVDSSGSMTEDAGFNSLTKMEATINAIKTVLASIPPYIKVSVYSFTDGLRKIGDRNPESPGKIIDAMNEIDISGNTALFDSVRTCNDFVPKESASKIIVISDGADNSSRNTSIPVVYGEKTRKTGQIDVIGFKIPGHESERKDLISLAKLNNGNYKDANTVQELEKQIISSCTELVIRK